MNRTRTITKMTKKIQRIVHCFVMTIYRNTVVDVGDVAIDSFVSDVERLELCRERLGDTSWFKDHLRDLFQEFTKGELPGIKKVEELEVG